MRGGGTNDSSGGCELAEDAKFAHNVFGESWIMLDAIMAVLGRL